MVQKDSSQRKSGIRYSYKALRAACVAGACGLVVVSACNNGRSEASKKADSTAAAKTSSADAKKDSSVTPSVGGPLDTALYNKKLAQLANGDSSTPVIPALHYIAVTAQGAPGKDGKYRLRMPFKQIDSILHIAARINALVFLDIQVGFSDVQAEVPQLEKYLKMPNVHLGIDPEFSMKTGKKPGKVIGTMDASDVNFVSNYLANLAKANNLPPKILVVHRFTRPMITNYKSIKTHPDVQIVMDMDGWCEPTLKYDSYKPYVSNEPVQFTGFKLFYKNDIRKPKSRLLTPKEVLSQKPSPIYIQYQ